MISWDAYCSMGVVKLPERRNYWNRRNYCTEENKWKGFLWKGFNYRDIFDMTHERFDTILHSLAFASTKPNYDDPDQARLHHVKILTTHLECVSRLLYRPGREVTVDEQVIKTKSSYCTFKVWFSEKPIKCGIKVISLNDKLSGGYTWTLKGWRVQDT